MGAPKANILRLFRLIFINSVISNPFRLLFITPPISLISLLDKGKEFKRYQGISKKHIFIIIDIYTLKIYN
jgi:hypothetical protein